MSFIIHFDPPPIPLRSSSPPNPLTFMYLSSLSLKKKKFQEPNPISKQKNQKTPHQNENPTSMQICKRPVSQKNAQPNQTRKKCHRKESSQPTEFILCCLPALSFEDRFMLYVERDFFKFYF